MNALTAYFIGGLKRLFAGLERVRGGLQPGFDRWLNRTTKLDEDGDRQGFVADSDYAILQQEPLRAQVLLKSIGIATALFLMWAAVSRVDEVTRGEGKVIPSRQLQVLQSLDGGVVDEILVHEGDVVEPEQILLRIDQTRFVSSVRESRVQYTALAAKAARLRALTEGTPFTLPDDVLKEDPKTAEEERRLYESRRSELETTTSIARQQLSQRQQELVEMRAKFEQASKAHQLAAQELKVTKPLINSGAVSEVELLRLERDVARFHGEREMAAAQISRLQAAIGEATRKVEEVGLAFRNESGKELAETMAKLKSLAESGVGLSDKVSRSVLRSPVKGTVKRLLINTVGGVVQPGKDVVEIVPLEDNLLLEARVQPRDIAFLHPGQKAVVKFTAYDFAIYGGLEGQLEHIGADTVVDEKGNAFYIVRVRTHESSVGNNLPVIPGMIAEVDIVTGEKSVLSYLLKPVLRAKARAFSER
ncbi:MAG TPA: HlyD family type I secretion periplasmic adaptor subunit [Accumulibacter sp.]|nr:HlyD family type I secretion periplasmic adaptor subunit [Accumulibacter sp.]HMW18611.1 HlyD family type I secretion periplasmic adaptor subunit [Accumulibacter sp.]HMX23710.1 HlyD family type I secretion periplasmic adaptor subunit [Accumulibacter sp.]HMY06927.1 HlyD family type I secretion periplasmic adaptor subunit [Accumulibacter sp.]HND80895.1 HlyD family type I secretion periplasmic adaptor subunit [Accumulibacter sp.]